MVSRVSKEKKEDLSVVFIVVAVIFGLVFIYGIFGSKEDKSIDNYLSNDYQPSSAVQNNYQPSSIVQNNIEEPKDNRPQCPAGNNADSGQKTEDWFSCSDIKKKLELKLNKDKIDCSNQNNFQTSKLDFQIIRYCEADINGKISKLYGSSSSNEDNCESLYQGILKPQVIYDAFPSLNEYKFYSVGISIDNIGCTKENLSDYLVFYSLYQKNQLLASNYVVLGQSYFGSQILEPQAGNDFFVTQLNFGDGSLYSNNPILRIDPQSYTFKICLLNAQGSLVLSCDWADFDMNYEQ